MFKSEIEIFCRSIGLDTIGFIPCRSFKELEPFYKERQACHLQNEFEEQSIEKRINPNHYMENAKTIISIAFPYTHLEEQTSSNGFSIYTKRLDYHRVVKAYLDKVCQFIESLGGQAKGFVDSNTLPERTLAYLAGVGFIGKNNMLITKRYGSYVFLGEILTDLEIESKEQRSLREVSQYVECGSCQKCLAECPTQSIHPKRKNPNICLSYFTQKKELLDQEIKLLRGNIFGCDFCQTKCPYNEQRASSPLEEFRTLEVMHEDASTYAAMDNKYFKAFISQTSCGWRGKNVLRRNALIHLHERGEEIEGFLGDSDYLNEYIRRLQRDKNK